MNIKKDYIYTTITQFIVLATLLLSYQLISAKFGEDIFYQFSIIKRDLIFIMAVLGLGLYTSLVKHTASSCEKYYKSYLSSLYLFSCIYMFVFYIFIYIFDNEILVFFNLQGLSFRYLYPMLITFTGMMLHNVIYGYLRGRVLVKYVNFYDILSKAAAPIFSIIASSSLVDFFIIHGVYQILLSFVVFMISIKNNIFYGFKTHYINIKMLISFGFKRVASDLGINILLVAPLFLANDNIGITAFLLMIVSSIGYIFTPLGNVILPRISLAIKEGSYAKLYHLVRLILLYVLILSSSIVISFIFFAEQFIPLFVQNISVQLLETSNYMLVSAIPYVLFLVSKNIIDSVTNKAINSYNIVFTIIIFLIGYKFLEFIDNTVAISFLISMLFLSMLSIISVHRLMRIYK
jgi:O-antigen/teichoic acid export membrane protein